MKKRIIAWAVLLSVCAAALGLWCSAAVGICLLLGVLVWLFLKGTKKLREKTAVR